MNACGETVNSPQASASPLLYAYDRAIVRESGGVIIGIDEAGRGPLAGPVVAAAVALDLDKEIPGINDSKKLTAAAREKLYARITAEAVSWGAAEATVEEIERLNILQATLLAMRRAIEKLRTPWSLAIIDGNQIIRDLPAGRQRAIVGGDGRSACIAAASIIAKVTRDRLMKLFHDRYPMYDFYTNKGYGTARHCASITVHGLCEIHRPSFCKTLKRSETGAP